MADLTALIERLEKADGPDRELDGSIHNRLFGTEYVRSPRSVTGFLTSSENNGCPTVPAYTASIDAAVALAERVLPGSLYRIEKLGDGSGLPTSKRGWATAGLPGEQEQAYAATPALAICIATLRALSAQEGSK